MSDRDAVGAQPVSRLLGQAGLGVGALLLLLSIVTIARGGVALGAALTLPGMLVLAFGVVCLRRARPRRTT